MKAKPVKPLRSSKSTPPPPVESRKITILSSDGYPFEVHPIKLMGVPSLYKAVEGRGTESRVLRLTDAVLEHSEVIGLFVELLVHRQCMELKGNSLPDSWGGVQKYVHLVQFLDNAGHCEDLIALFCYQLGKAVEGKKLAAVWGALLGGLAKDVDLMVISLKAGDVNDTWTTEEDVLVTDGLTTAEGWALVKADAASGGDRILLGANRLDPSSWSKEMRGLICKDYLLALYSGWTKVEPEVHLLEGYVAMSPTEVGSDDGRDSPSPSLFVRTSSYRKRNLLSRGGAAYFSRRLASLSIGTARKADTEQELSDLSRSSGTDRTSSETDPMVAVWKQYAEEVKGALAELNRSAPVAVLHHPVPVPAGSAKDRMRHILAYGVNMRSKINEQR